MLSILNSSLASENNNNSAKNNITCSGENPYSFIVSDGNKGDNKYHFI